MTAAFFLVDPAVLVTEVGGTVVVDGAEGRHAVTVRRIGVGEPVLVGDGAGRVVEGKVAAALGRDVLEVEVISFAEHPVPTPRVVVVQALPKGERGELAVELMTELGVDEIVPWAAARSITQWDSGPRGAKALTRWRRTAQEAAKQSRRPWVPVVAGPASTAAVARRLSGGLVLHEAAQLPLAVAELPTTGEIVLVVGPEGGISDDELSTFLAAGATAVRLGSPVLRTSTAGPAALAALSLRLGRWA